jgi:hypothetical protein
MTADKKTIFGTILLLLFGWFSIVLAKDIQFEATVDRTRVSLGESLQLNLSFYGTQDVPAPDIGDIDGFQLRYLGPSTRMSIVNGQVSTSITHIYILIPLETGTFQIGPFSVSYQGKTFTSQALTIEVVSGPSPPGIGPQGPAPGHRALPQEELKDRIFLTIEAGKSNVYVNESVPLSIKLYINRLAVRDIQYPKFEHEGFSIKEFVQPKQYRQTIGGIVYDVIEFNTRMFAVKAGELVLGPAQLDCNLVIRKQVSRRHSMFDDDFFGGFFDDDIFDDFFGRYETYPFQVTSRPLKITVLPLPKEGRPDTFKGAVGNFQFDAQIQPKEVKAGDPITVTITVSGQGNFDTVSCPTLSSKEGFKVYQPQVKQGQTAKVFEQVLIPQSETITEIPEIIFSFFDPQTKSYRRLSWGPFPITVTKPEGSELKIVESPQAVTKIAKEEPLGRDIVYIKEFPGRLRRRSWYLHRRPGYWFYQLAVLILSISLMIFRKHQEKLRTDERYARRLHAPGKARRGILQAQQFLKQARTEEFFETVHRTMRGYLADKFHLPSGGLTPEIVRQALGNKGIDEDVLNRLMDIFSACDMARYAPLEFDKARCEIIFNDMRKVIDYLEKRKA